MYEPDRGDIVWITFNPTSGHEQAGHRPAVVLSPGKYNVKAGLCICCPITFQVKGYPFEIALPNGLPVSGVILADQVKSLDWQERQASFVCRIPPVIVDEILEKLSVLLQT